jgi:hypothetical protein
MVKARVGEQRRAKRGDCARWAVRRRGNASLKCDGLRCSCDALRLAWMRMWADLVTLAIFVSCSLFCALLAHPRFTVYSAGQERFRTLTSAYYVSGVASIPSRFRIRASNVAEGHRRSNADFTSSPCHPSVRTPNISPMTTSARCARGCVVD